MQVLEAGRPAKSQIKGELGMSVFDNEEDQRVVKSLGLTMLGFAGLTVFLIIFAHYMT